MVAAPLATLLAAPAAQAAHGAADAASVEQAQQLVLELAALDSQTAGALSGVLKPVRCNTSCLAFYCSNRWLAACSCVPCGAGRVARLRQPQACPAF